MGKGRVVRVHLHLCEHGGDALLDAPVEELLPQRVLQVVADIALAHRHADRQRARDVALGVGAHQLRHGVLDHAHLRAVPVHDDDLVPRLDQVRDRRGGLLHRDHLLRQIVAQGVAAEGEDYSFAHGNILSFGRVSE